MNAGSAPVGVFVGLATLDVIHRVSRRPGADEKVTAVRQDIAAGGPATNAAVTYAALGGRARLVTALGAAPPAALITDELASRGVQVVDVDPDSVTPPAVSAIAVDDATGARSVVSVDAAGRSVRPPSPGEWERLLTGAGVLLLDGHHALLAVSAALAAVAAGVPVVLDAGRWKPVMAELIPLADDVICSAEFRWPGTADPASSAAAIRAVTTPRSAGTAHDGDSFTRAVAVTQGAGPVLWWQGTSSGEVPVPAVRAVDTLGAGDAFHGAYAYRRAEDGSFADRLAGAARVAALRVRTVGPRDWLSTLHPAQTPNPLPSTGQPRTAQA